MLDDGRGANSLHLVFAGFLSRIVLKFAVKALAKVIQVLAKKKP